MAIYEGISFASITLEDQASKASDQYELKLSDPELFERLSLINFFVGPVNSGKSRFLRGIFASKNLQVVLKNYDMDSVYSAVEIFKQQIDLKLPQRVPSYTTDLFKSDIEDFILNSVNNLRIQYKKKLMPRREFIYVQNVIESLNTLARGNDNGIHTVLSKHRLQSWETTAAVEVIKNEINELLIKLEEIKNRLPGVTDCPSNSVYVPILRSLRSSPQDTNFLLTTTHKDYFSKTQNIVDWSEGERTSIFNGTGIYRFLTKKILDSSKARRQVQAYEEFLSREFFQDKEVQISPKSDDDVVHIKIGNDEDRPIHALGDGMQALLTITLPAFFEQERCLFFVEEPEIYLHPGLQRRLIDIISKHESLCRHQWFFTTHSNHMLDLTLDYSCISVFHFTREINLDSGKSKFLISQMTSPDHNILSSLGVMGSSVFRTNALIWVEGVTDRLYLKQILRIFMKKIKINFTEDLHFSFIEFGGGNIPHFNFSKEKSNNINVTALINKSFVVIDGDNREKDERFQKLQDDQKEDVFCFVEKEIENVLPVEAIKFAVSKILENSRNVNDVDNCLHRVKNICSEQLKKRAIGDYLEETLKIETESKEKYFAASSGTLKQYHKSKFCEYVLEFMSNEENDILLEGSIEQLAINLVRFISTANQVGFISINQTSLSNKSPDIEGRVINK